MKKQKAQQGITLIALIITIVVLLILAVVAIGAIQESKIIAHAQNAASDYTLAQEKEQITLGYSEYKINLVNDSDAELKIEGAIVIDSETDGFVVKFEKTSNLYSISPDGNVELIKDEVDNIDHDTIIEILEDVFNQRITEAEAVQRLKDKGAIEQDAVSFIDSISVEQLYNDDYTDTGIYLYCKKINALYKYSETDSGIIFSYVDSSFAYQQTKCMRITRETLEDIFLGENEVPADLIPSNLEDLKKPENEKKFLDYIVNNSNGRIKSIGGIGHVSVPSSISLADLLLVDENGKEIMIELVDENGEKITALFGENSGHSVELNIKNGSITSIDVYAGT